MSSFTVSETMDSVAPAETENATLLSRVSSQAWLSTLAAGIIIGILLSIFAISLINVIFVGPLASELPHGLAMALATLAVSAFTITLFSGESGIVGNIQDAPLVAMAGPISAVAASQTAPEAVLPTIILLIALTTLASGGLLLLLGRFKMGMLVRYLPYPVIGGFMTGTGLLLLLGGIGNMIGRKLTLGNFVVLFSGEQIELWVPGILFGLLLFIGTRRIRHSLTLPGMILVEGIFFYLLLLLMFNDSSVKAVADAGFLLGDVGRAGSWPLITPGHIRSVDWNALQGQLGNIAAVLIITPIILLLNLTGVEINERKDMDLNYELRVAGKTNILSALAGGMIGFHSLGYTILGRQMATGRPRALGFIVGLIPLFLLFFGLPLLAFMPRGLLGSLLVFQGFTFLYNWLIKKWDSLPLIDYGLIVIISLVIATAGFMAGIILGLVITMITFVISYSRTDIFYRKLSGAEITSNVQRTPRYRKQLIRQGWQTHILELHGFIFFGTGNAVLAEVQDRLRKAAPLRHLILDFRRVTGVDSSAAFSLIKIFQLTESSDFIILFSKLPFRVEQQLLCNGIRPGDTLKIFPDLDRALEWCEEKLLQCGQLTMTRKFPLPLQLLNSGFSKEQVGKIKYYLNKLILVPNDVLVRQGENADAVYFIESGRISVYLNEYGQVIRLQTLFSGMLIGEVGFCLNVPRSATIVADADSVVYRLTRSSMTAMLEEEPLLARKLNDTMLRSIARRLISANHQIAELNE